MIIGSLINMYGSTSLVDMIRLKSQTLTFHIFGLIYQVNITKRVALHLSIYGKIVLNIQTQMAVSTV